MNTTNNHLLKSISKEEVTQLTAIVKETIAFEVNLSKTFTAADLWNIQRSRKSSLQRRHFA